MLKLSIVIPCRNEVQYIEECVEAIYASTLEEEIEMHVYVVDGMSTDGTRDKIENLQEHYKTLFLVDNTKMLTPFAFNLGISANLAVDYVQIVGARHILSKNYLQNCLSILKQDKTVWCVGGKIQNEYLNHVGEYISIAMGTKFGMGLGNFRTLEVSGFTDTVTSPMYPKFVFDQIGLFDEELIRNQDDDFNYRVVKAGGRIYFDATISLRYYVRGTIKNLWKQFGQYGYWKVYVNKKHRAITTMRQLIPPAFVLYLLLLPIVFLIDIKLGCFAAIPFVLYVLLDIFVSVKSSSNLKAFSYLITIFPILHISYGWGYLKGIFRFLLLNKKPSSNSKTLSR